MGNTYTSKIVGIGDICLETNIGNKLVLRDVQHVLDIRLNLISTDKLDNEGLDSYHSGGKWKNLCLNYKVCILLKFVIISGVIDLIHTDRYYILLNKFSNWNCRALPNREPFQKFSKAKAEPRPKRGFGNSFQPAIDAPRLLPH
ncbi:hypothetical protein ACOSQ2_020913 [Xanthoceras sorbifolium]